MKIAIIADIHDHTENLSWVIEELKKHDIERTFLLGDYCAPFIVEQLLQIDTSIDAVWGNNDADKQQILEVSREHEHDFIFSLNDFAEIDYDNKTYFITHYPILAENAALSGKYDAVFHAHTHEKREEMINDTPVINPGKLSTYPNNERSFAIFDTADNTVEFIDG